VSQLLGVIISVQKLAERKVGGDSETADRAFIKNGVHFHILILLEFLNSARSW
jgi:hypothetical protein